MSKLTVYKIEELNDRRAEWIVRYRENGDTSWMLVQGKDELSAYVEFVKVCRANGDMVELGSNEEQTNE